MKETPEDLEQLQKLLDQSLEQAGDFLRSSYPNHTDFTLVETLQREFSGQSVRDWGDGVYLPVEAEVIYTFARYREP